ncbi:leucyl/phenylalanyl-tRNA--protein transferase [Mumia sp.]|uniref:leucyl/phenylalanyl-tRNA--protein transferase n=1 Tax=Mumia sp. TaxID=1965300 RepID=UPI00261220EE|nr:leucyl/phenylalanyl-tRNA--protein transferase [Mumia sp.]MDD9350456.1 leucyl/phenylalanyl-tRNA--protein transferase [Mumia sp.]
MTPQPLPPNHWEFGRTHWPDDDFVGIGADLEPGTLVAAYAAGMFPMPVEPEGPIGWWSPVQRGVLQLDRLRVTRSLRKSAKYFTVTVDTDFHAVVEACADPSREGAWIDGQIAAAYSRLHDLGWAHSVEVRGTDGALVGGLYGVAVGGLFAGESMFHRERDASKVALLSLVELLSDEYAAQRLVDVQWLTPHLASLGAEAWPRDTYLDTLRRVVDTPLPPPWR